MANRSQSTSPSYLEIMDRIDSQGSQPFQLTTEEAAVLRLRLFKLKRTEYLAEIISPRGIVTVLTAYRVVSKVPHYLAKKLQPRELKYLQEQLPL